MNNQDPKQIALSKPATLAEALAAAPRKPKLSLRAYIRENSFVLRRARDEGVAWDEIVALIAKDLRIDHVDRKTVETYIARDFPAKKAREELRKKKLAERSASEPRPQLPVTASFKPNGAADPSQPNPFMPKRLPPKSEA